MVDITKAKDFLLTTDFPLDKVIYLKSGSFSVSGYPGSNSVAIPHGLPFIPLCDMSWSLTPDFSVCYPAGSSPPPTNIALDNQGVENLLYADATNINISVSNFLTPAITFYYRIYAFEPSDSSTDLEPTASAGDDFVLNTDFNYTKLYLEGKLDLSVTDTVTHNLGYIPQIEAWDENPLSVTPSFPQRIIPPLFNDNTLDTTGGGATYGFILTTTTLQFLSQNTPAPTFLHYRIYLDEGS